MVEQACLASLRAKFHVGGMTWADFTRVYLESCTWRVAIFTMDQRKEQRVCIKFCANLGKSATETLEMIQQGFGDQSLSRTQVYMYMCIYIYVWSSTVWSAAVLRFRWLLKENKSKKASEILASELCEHSRCCEVRIWNYKRTWPLQRARKRLVIVAPFTWVVGWHKIWKHIPPSPSWSYPCLLNFINELL